MRNSALLAPSPAPPSLPGFTSLRGRKEGRAEEDGGGAWRGLPLPPSLPLLAALAGPEELPAGGRPLRPGSGGWPRAPEEEAEAGPLGARVRKKVIF
ncbi:Hypothetical predicted protein [Podarcis lilfordi]|uniref:Uncharacterized protein n=1 Tax=Podarcis lilfordi TaxID=74358 RepID=A0AA35KR64_9SAUR|nr:Hypothetical predicted protein [Podarcis lilfordi]